MFESKSRIMVVGSSISKKNTGPRKGSIGYFVGANSSFSMSHPNRVCVCDAEVVFARFGYDTAYRAERKKVLMAFPSSVIEPGKPSKGKVKALIELLSSGKIDAELRAVNPYFSANTPIIVAVPCYPDFVEIYKNERQAWAEAMLDNGLGFYVNKMLGSGHFTNSTMASISDSHFLGSLIGICTDRECKNDFIKNKVLKTTEEEFKSVVGVLKAINLVQSRQTVNYWAEVFRQQLLQNKHSHKSSSDPILNESNFIVFHPYVLSTLKEAIKDLKEVMKGHEPKLLIDLYDSLMDSISECTTLSRLHQN